MGKIKASYSKMHTMDISQLQLQIQLQLHLQHKFVQCRLWCWMAELDNQKQLKDYKFIK